MAIRETFRRALRRSDDSNDSQTGSTLASTTTTTSNDNPVPSSPSSSSLHKTSSRLTNWSWSSGKEKEAPKERKPKDKGKKRVVHPSQRPLTNQNLAHQEMLSHFNMIFGASNSEQIETGSFMGISPCCTRTPSLIGDESSSDGSATPRSCSD